MGGAGGRKKGVYFHSVIISGGVGSLQCVTKCRFVYCLCDDLEDTPLRYTSSIHLMSRQPSPQFVSLLHFLDPYIVLAIWGRTRYSRAVDDEVQAVVEASFVA